MGDADKNITFHSIPAFHFQHLFMHVIGNEMFNCISLFHEIITRIKVTSDNAIMSSLSQTL